MPRTPQTRRLKDPYTAYVDGASRKDGRGGWGASIRRGAFRRDLCGGMTDTTNNRMELQAAIEALYEIDEIERGVRQDVTVVCDSQYVIQGITNYLPDWKFRNWRTAANNEVKNKDLWMMLDGISKKHNVVWEWIKGHTGHEGNERADALATMGVPEAVSRG